MLNSELMQQLNTFYITYSFNCGRHSVLIKNNAQPFVINYLEFAASNGIVSHYQMN